MSSNQFFTKQGPFPLKEIIEKIKCPSNSKVDEFNIYERSQTPKRNNDIVNIPSGYFLNYRYGVKRNIPLYITKKRWQNALKHAIDNKKVLHLWSHPHNFILGNNQFKLLTTILEMVKEAADDNKIFIMTQNEYCNFIKGKTC